ncbi:hypothetical protein Hanom_Chr09g00842551 [Helianthus anomalus]
MTKLDNYLQVVAKLEISDRGSKRIYLKISIKRGVENVYAQKILYENYIHSTNEQKVRGGWPPPPSPTILRPCLQDADSSLSLGR